MSATLWSLSTFGGATLQIPSSRGTLSHLRFLQFFFASQYIALVYPTLLPGKITSIISKILVAPSRSEQGVYLRLQLAYGRSQLTDVSYSEDTNRLGRVRSIQVVSKKVTHPNMLHCCNLFIASCSRVKNEMTTCQRESLNY